MEKVIQTHETHPTIKAVCLLDCYGAKKRKDHHLTFHGVGETAEEAEARAVEAHGKAMGRMVT